MVLCSCILYHSFDGTVECKKCNEIERDKITCSRLAFQRVQFLVLRHRKKNVDHCWVSVRVYIFTQSFRACIETGMKKSRICFVVVTNNLRVMFKVSKKKTSDQWDFARIKLRFKHQILSYFDPNIKFTVGKKKANRHDLFTT